MLLVTARYCVCCRRRPNSMFTKCLAPGVMVASPCSFRPRGTLWKRYTEAKHAATNCSPTPVLIQAIAAASSNALFKSDRGKSRDETSPPTVHATVGRIWCIFLFFVNFNGHFYASTSFSHANAFS